jgi:hypothetical protein
MGKKRSVRKQAFGGHSGRRRRSKLFWRITKLPTGDDGLAERYNVQQHSIAVSHWGPKNARNAVVPNTRLMEGFSVEGKVSNTPVSNPRSLLSLSVSSTVFGTSSFSRPYKALLYGLVRQLLDRVGRTGAKFAHFGSGAR